MDFILDITGGGEKKHIYYNILLNCWEVCGEDDHGVVHKDIENSRQIISNANDCKWH